MSPGARNSRIFALENMLSTSSSTLVSMASHLSEAEERERVFSGRGRWNQVRSLAEAKNMMNYLFNLASSSRYCVQLMGVCILPSHPSHVATCILVPRCSASASVCFTWIVAGYPFVNHSFSFSTHSHTPPSRILVLLSE